MTRLLLEHGANINQQEISGTTPLMKAVDCDNVSMTRLLLEHGANVALVDEMGQTALDRAVIYQQDKECVRLLMAHGADPNHADNNGNTAIWFADKQHRPDLVRLLRGKRKVWPSPVLRPPSPVPGEGELAHVTNAHSLVFTHDGCLLAPFSLATQER